MNKTLIKQIDETTTDIEEKVDEVKQEAKKFFKDHNTKMGGALAGFIVILALFMALRGLIFLNHWSMDNQIVTQAPLVIKWQKPIYIKSTKAPVKVQQHPEIKRVPTPKPKTEGDIMYNELFERLRTIESQKGTAESGHHIFCRNKGMWNEVGYGNRTGYCFEDMAEGKATITKWFQARFQEGMTLQQALCYYDTGTQMDSCEYSEKYLSFNN